MQAIILAAGESSRFWPLNKRHKSLFKIMGRPLICYVLDNLKRAGIKEVIIVQGPKGDIEKELKNCPPPKFSAGIKYVVQKIPRGTGDALKSAEKHLKEKFLVLYGDDFYGVEDLKNCLTKFPSLLVKEVANPAHFGVIVKEKVYVKAIVEKPKNPPSNLVNAGGYFVPKTMLAGKIEKSERGEYEITDYFNKLAQKTKVYFSKAKEWFPLSFSWDLLNINEFLLKGLKTKIEGKVENDCRVKNPVFVGKGTVVRSGTYIEGPVYIGENCEVRPSAYIRPSTFIAQDCLIGHGVEIKNSIICRGSKVAHFSYVSDSIIGEGCNLGGGTLIADLRFDEKNVRTMVKGKLIDTGRRKFGAVLGAGVKVGVNVSIMPGVLVGQDSIVGPHSLVRENIEDNKIFYTKFHGVVKN